MIMKDLIAIILMAYERRVLRVIKIPTIHYTNLYTLLDDARFEHLESFIWDKDLNTVIARIIDKNRQDIGGDVQIIVIITGPGLISKDRKSIVSCRRLGIDKPLGLDEELREKFCCRVRLVNDTDALALGEAITVSGSYQDMTSVLKNYLYVYAGLGVGSTLYINGKPYVGGGSGGHIGRLIVQLDGLHGVSGHGLRGELETYASLHGIIDVLKKHADAHNDSDPNPPSQTTERLKKLHDIAHADFKLWQTLLEFGDYEVQEAVEAAKKYLSLALSQAATFLHPQTIILGGELIKETPNLFDGIRVNFSKLTWQKVREEMSLKEGGDDIIQMQMRGALVDYAESIR